MPPMMPVVRIVGGLVGVGGTLCCSLKSFQRANPTLWGFSPPKWPQQLSVYIKQLISTAGKYSEWDFRRPCPYFHLCNRIGSSCGGDGDSGKAGGGGDGGKGDGDGVHDSVGGIKAGLFTMWVSKSHQSSTQYRVLKPFFHASQSKKLTRCWPGG